jgi:hypothetical protein
MTLRDFIIVKVIWNERASLSRHTHTHSLGIILGKICCCFGRTPAGDTKGMVAIVIPVFNHAASNECTHDLHNLWVVKALGQQNFGEGGKYHISSFW